MGDVNHEPTMEEILASIKKIIAEDGGGAVSGEDARPRRVRPAERAEQAVVEEAVADDVLELTDQIEAETATDEPVPVADPIMSEETAKAGQAALAALSALASPSPEDSAEAHPLEGLVREMLRPMLKEWLDENLPGLVEEMVAREIARIATNRR